MTPPCYNRPERVEAGRWVDTGRDGWECSGCRWLPEGAR